MRLRATWIADYELPKNITERLHTYGAVDPIACAEVDMSHDYDTLFEAVVGEENMTLTVETVARVMVSGPREWQSYSTVRAMFDEVEQWAFAAMAQKIQLVHGGAEGLDSIANAQALIRAQEGGPWLTPEVHRPRWRRADGTRNMAAGFERNTKMIQSDLDIACVFLMACTKPACKNKPAHNTHGTSQAYDELKKADIPIRIYQG
jgi:hypothetical protein